MSFLLLFIALFIGIDVSDNLDGVKTLSEVPPKVWFEAVICIVLILASAIMMIFAPSD